MKNEKALVVFSGGQDSVTCLGIALTNYKHVEAISFSYGQRHSIELDCARKICTGLIIPHKFVDISFLGQLVTSELTGTGDVNKPHAYKEGLPASFVPNRNALFLTIAHAFAQEIDARHIYAGMCETDYSGYPDCRQDFIDAFAGALNIGYKTSIMIYTPLMHLTKAQTFALAAKHGVLELVLEDSHTCYLGDRSQRHSWGYGCGTCPACVLRATGWDEFQKSLTEDGKNE